MTFHPSIFLRCASAAFVAATIALAQQTPTIIPVPSSASVSTNVGAGLNGIALGSSGLFFTQPFCLGDQERGVYKANIASPVSGSTGTLVSPIPEIGPCSENYLAISSGLGGFATGDTYATGVSTMNPADEAVYKNGSLFIDGLPATKQHAFVTFDTAGTFGNDLIVTLEGEVRGYNAAGTMKFTYNLPASGPLYALEGATVAPMTFSYCPGCLYITGELASNVNNSGPTGFGAIFVVPAGTPSGSSIAFVSNSPGVEPEGLTFVGNACSVDGFQYFVSGYGTVPDIDNPTSTSGAILAFTPTQLAPYMGQFLVPDEGSRATGPGVISVFNGTGFSAVPFSTTGYQLEGSAILGPSNPQCGCTIPAANSAIGGSPVSWNKFNTVGNDTVWIHAHIGTPSGIPTNSVTTVNFTGVTFVLNGITYNLPDGLLIFDPAAPATPSTTFDALFLPYGRWITTLNPSHLSDEIFFDGNGIPVDNNISGGGKATFNFTTSTSDTSLKFRLAMERGCIHVLAWQ